MHLMLNLPLLCQAEPCVLFLPSCDVHDNLQLSHDVSIGLHMGTVQNGVVDTAGASTCPWKKTSQIPFPHQTKLALSSHLVSHQPEIPLWTKKPDTWS